MNDPINQNPIVVQQAIRDLRTNIKFFQYNHFVGVSSDHIWKVLIHARDTMEKALNDLWKNIPSQENLLKKIQPVIIHFESERIYMVPIKYAEDPISGITFYFIDRDTVDDYYNRILAEAWKSSEELLTALIFKGNQKHNNMSSDVLEQI